MDNTGLYRWRKDKTDYPVNRPLTWEEKANQYKQSEAAAVEPKSYLSVIKMNSTYMDVVDRWYPLKGFSVWFGLSGALVSCFGACAIIWMFFGKPIIERHFIHWILILFVLPVAIGLIFYCFWLVGFECFRWTHYPIRFNRKSGQVHFFQQDGSVLTVPWNKLFITKGKSESRMVDHSEDLRAHMLAEDGETVLDTFTIGYPVLGGPEAVDQMWALIQPYMEAPDGAKKAYEHNQGLLMPPIDGRRESVKWGVVEAFVFGSPWPILQLFVCIPFGLNAAGRILAMRTCKVPQWPQDVQAQSVIDKNDPYVLTSDDNFPLGWRYFYWPLICTILGVGAYVGVIAWMIITQLILK